MRHDLSNAPETNTWPSYRAAEFILERLSGFAKYPETEKGREVFIEALMTCADEAQARQVVNAFDEKFPTLKELREAIYSLKTRAENEALMGSLKEKWESEGATYDPDWAAQLAKEFADLCAKKAMDRKAREAEKSKQRMAETRKMMEEVENKPKTN
jgi:hypothetical protein